MTKSEGLCQGLKKYDTKGTNLSKELILINSATISAKIVNILHESQGSCVVENDRRPIKIRTVVRFQVRNLSRVLKPEKKQTY